MYLLKLGVKLPTIDLVRSHKGGSLVRFVFVCDLYVFTKIIVTFYVFWAS